MDENDYPAEYLYENTFNTCGECKQFYPTLKDRGECLYGDGSTLIVKGFQRGCSHWEEKE